MYSMTVDGSVPNTRGGEELVRGLARRVAWPAGSRVVQRGDPRHALRAQEVHTHTLARTH